MNSYSALEAQLEHLLSNEPASKFPPSLALSVWHLLPGVPRAAVQACDDTSLLYELDRQL